MYDKNWYTFGPFNPSEGEFVDQWEGYVFKVIAEGVTGDDGNLYRYYLSTNADKNVPIEGGNAFAYEYSCRMYDDPGEVSHIYPYIDDRTVSVRFGDPGKSDAVCPSSPMPSTRTSRRVGSWRS